MVVAGRLLPVHLRPAGHPHLQRGRPRGADLSTGQRAVPEAAALRGHHPERVTREAGAHHDGCACTPCCSTFSDSARSGHEPGPVTAVEVSARERDGMRRIPGGSFVMGSEDFYPEERPVRRVDVAGFWIDERPVTVAHFRRFVKATSYVTVAERQLDPAEFPGADLAELVPGSLVFRRTRGPVDLRDFRNWWAYVPGACWTRPEGTVSDTYTRGRHPVTQVAYEDAEAY